MRAGAKIDRKTPLSRRSVVYFCSGAHTGDALPEFSSI
jgi:hypothetical protein